MLLFYFLAFAGWPFPFFLLCLFLFFMLLSSVKLFLLFFFSIVFAVFLFLCFYFFFLIFLFLWFVFSLHNLRWYKIWHPLSRFPNPRFAIFAHFLDGPLLGMGPVDFRKHYKYRGLNAFWPPEKKGIFRSKSRVEMLAAVQLKCWPFFLTLYVDSILTLHLVGSAGRKRFPKKTRAKGGQHLTLQQKCMWALQGLCGIGGGF